MPTKHWPLFDLRITTPRLRLATPSDADLLELADVVAKGVHDPSVMPFSTAWTDLPTGGERERRLLQYHWSCRANWKPTSWKQSFGVFLDGKIIGVQDVLADDFAIRRTVETGSWLGLEYQGQGFGKEMRSAILSFAFDTLGTEYAETGAFEDNLRSQGVTRSLGYSPNGFSLIAVRGKGQKLLRFTLDRKTWETAAQDRIAVNVEGFELCREMFGG